MVNQYQLQALDIIEKHISAKDEELIDHYELGEVFIWTIREATGWETAQIIYLLDRMVDAKLLAETTQPEDRTGQPMDALGLTVKGCDALGRGHHLAVNR